MPPSFWQLSSSSGRETVRWDVREVRATEGALVCDVRLEGQYFGDGLGEASAAPDYGLLFRGLAIRVADLERLCSYLGEWLRLPIGEQARHPLSVVCDVGGLFDQSLTLSLGHRDDTLSGGHPTATFRYIAGRLTGELSFVVDPSCLQVLCDGIGEALKA